jgi:hypothetical protein
VAAHTQIFKQLNGRSHHIPVNINTENNGLRFPIKRHHLASWINKVDPTIFCLKEIYPIDRNKHWLREKKWKKIYQANGLPKSAGVAVLTTAK